MSSAGHDGEIKGTLDWVNDGKFGGALKFPGKGDSYVRVDHDDVSIPIPTRLSRGSNWKPPRGSTSSGGTGDVWPEPEDVRHLDIWIHDADYPVFMWHVKGKCRAY